MAEVSLREIAERLGCSRATVSYALRNSPNVSQAMRVRVQALAEELGWRPDARLQKQMALVRGSVLRRDMPKLAILVNKSSRQLDREAAQRNVLQGACQYAKRRGYSVDLFRLADEPMRPERFRSILVARGVEAIIYVGTMDPGIPMEFLKAGFGFACVVTGVRYPEVPYHVVMPDHLAGGRLVVGELKRRGYCRPAAILPRGIDAALGYAFTGGLSSGLVELEECDQLKIQRVGRDENRIPQYEWDRIATWISRNRPDSIVTTDVEAMHQLLRVAVEPIARLPVFSLDWFPGQPVSGGLDQMQRHVGEAAVDLVVAQIHRGERGLPSVQRVLAIEGVWRDGDLEGDDHAVEASLQAIDALNG